MLPTKELRLGGVYILHDDEEGDTFSLCKILSMNHNDIWISVHEDSFKIPPSRMLDHATVTIRTSADAITIWGVGNQSRLLRIEPVSANELQSCDTTLYPDQPLIKVQTD